MIRDETRSIFLVFFLWYTDKHIHFLENGCLNKIFLGIFQQFGLSFCIILIKINLEPVLPRTKFLSGLDNGSEIMMVVLENLPNKQ
jgi:hypothetical protein